MKHISKINIQRFRWHKIILLVLSLSSAISFAQQAEKPTKEQRESQTALRQAQKSLKNDNFIEAEADYRKAIALDPENQDARYNLGTAYYEKNKNDEAMLRFKQAAKNAQTKEEKHRAFHNLGNTFMNAEKYQEAVESYKNALRNDPTDDETRYNLALAKELLEKNPPPPEDQDQDQDQEQNEDQEQDENQDQEQNQDDQSSDGDQGDENEDEDKDKGDDSEDKGQPDQPEDQDNNQDQQPQEGQLSPQQIKSLLEAMENEERKVQEKMNAEKQKGSKIESDKNW